MIPYGKQSISDEDIQAVVEALKHDFITQGPTVEVFEKALAQKLGAKYAVAFNSGTSGLHAVYDSIGLSTGDEFITTPISFVATSNAGLYVGAKPIFVDVDENGNLNPELILEKITSKTKAIVPVHFSGNPVNLKKIKEITDEKNLIVIEDACHALGAEYDNSPIGSCKYSTATVLSFHPVKHITTGEGGAVLTNSEEIYQNLIRFRAHGISKKNTPQDELWQYEMIDLGFNYRITDFQSALGISQLKRLDEFVNKRREIAKTYDDAFSNENVIKKINPAQEARPSYHLYPIRLQNSKIRKSIFNDLRAASIACQVHYIPIPSQPFYKDLGYSMSDLPKAQQFYEQEISIPMYPALEKDQTAFIIKKILELSNKYK